MKNKILKYNAQVPRYTSYPTAPHFQPMVAETYDALLKMLPSDEAVSVYIHIPFCVEMCWYCGCHTTATRKYAPIEDYVSLLLREIQIVAQTIETRLKISHLHFGGGSPSMLQPDDFRRIMAGLRQHFDFTDHAEIAIEADPRGVTHDKAEAYQECGINRASFGIQDFSPTVQAAINRPQSLSVVERAVARLQDFGIHRINFDLMYGLPLQTMECIEDTVEKSLRMSPSRIALFGYAHVPWMKKHMRLIRDEDLPDAAARIDQFALAEQRLVAAGMTAIGIDHFVRAEDDMLQALRDKKLARNFQGYTTDGASTLIGLGVSSIGRMPQGFVQNAANMTEYSAAILAGNMPTYRGRMINAEDKLRADIISDLMCYLQVDIAQKLTQHNYAPDYFATVLNSMADLQQDGLVTMAGSIITINPAARQAVRVVCARFDAYFTGQGQKHAQVA